MNTGDDCSSDPEASSTQEAVEEGAACNRSQFSYGTFDYEPTILFEIPKMSNLLNSSSDNTDLAARRENGYQEKPSVTTPDDTSTKTTTTTAQNQPSSNIPSGDAAASNTDTEINSGDAIVPVSNESLASSIESVSVIMSSSLVISSSDVTFTSSGSEISSDQSQTTNITPMKTLTPETKNPEVSISPEEAGDVTMKMASLQTTNHSFLLPAKSQIAFQIPNAFPSSLLTFKFGNTSSVFESKSRPLSASLSTTTDSVWTHISQRVSTSHAPTVATSQNLAFTKSTGTSLWNNQPCFIAAIGSLPKTPALNFPSAEPTASKGFSFPPQSSFSFSQTTIRNDQDTGPFPKTQKLNPFASTQTKKPCTSERRYKFYHAPATMTSTSSASGAFSYSQVGSSKVPSSSTNIFSSLKQPFTVPDIKSPSFPTSSPKMMNGTFNWQTSASSLKVNENTFDWRATDCQKLILTPRRVVRRAQPKMLQLPTPSREPVEETQDSGVKSFEERRLEYYQSQNKTFVFGSPLNSSVGTYYFGIPADKGKKVHKEVQTLPEPDSAKAILKEIWKVLECPVCLDIVKSPIIQCSRGHHVCNFCWTKVLYCPLCKKSKSTVRNYAMETVMEKLPLPCKYRVDGCTAEMACSEKEQHEASCYFRAFICPVDFCTQAFAYTKMIDHFKISHTIFLTTASAPSENRPYSWEMHNRALTKFIQAFSIPEWGMFFLCHKEVEQTSCIWLQMIRATSEDTKFCYQIELADEKDFQGVSYKGPVTCLSDNADEIQHKCLRVSIGLISAMRDIAFHTRLKIWKNSASTPARPRNINSDPL